MPKMQVYLPDTLYEQVKSESARLNVSGILQEALTERLAELERRDALTSALAAHTAESGQFSDAELEQQAKADRGSAIYARKRTKRSSAA